MKLYQKSELKNSRIFFDKQPPIFLTIFIITTLFLLVSSILFSSILSKTYIVQAQGTVTTSDNTYVGALSDGILMELECVEGTYVKEGDVLFTVSNGSEGTQYQTLVTQLENEREKIEAIDKYITSLESNSNTMSNSGIEQEYYAKVEYYLSALKSEEDDKSNQSNALDRKKQKKQKIEVEIQTAQQEIASLEQEIRTLEEQQKDKEEIEKANIEEQVQSKRTTLEMKQSEVESKELEIESLQEELDSNSSAGGSQAYQTRLQLVSEAGTAKTSIETKIVELEGQIDMYQSQDALYQVKATQEGYIHYLSPVKSGMAIQKTQTIAEISKNEESTMLVEAYINASEISKVKIGDTVNIAVSGVNIQKYGTLTGKLESIDVGTTTQETNQGNLILYKCIISIEDRELKDSKNEVIEVLKSMPVEARIVYDQETYLDWVLEMLSFKN